MSFLLDTNVASEPTAKQPRHEVLAWIAAQEPTALYISAVTVAEIRYGIEACPDGARRRALAAWYLSSIGGPVAQVLPITFEVADAWGQLRRRAELLKRGVPILDAFIAATAEVHRLTLVTRNVDDFQVWGGPVFNPWTDA